MPAPKGNQYWKLAENGRSKQFESPEQLQIAIDEYFKRCDRRTKTVVCKDGNITEIPFPIPYTIEGLCCILECDRRTLLNYEKQKGYEAYFHTIKKAKNKIYLNKVERGLDGESNPTFAIFDMVNNSDYRNTSSHDHLNNGKEFKPDNINITIDGKDIKLQ